MRRVFIVFLIFVALAGSYAWFFLYNKSHANIHDEEVAFNGSSMQLKDQFLKADGSLDSSLLDKVIVIHGEVSESESKSYIINESIICHLDSTLNADPLHEHIRVKGRLLGINDDDLLYGTLIVIDQAFFYLE